jgi:Ca2+-binding RTX toxin-like protein
MTSRPTPRLVTGLLAGSLAFALAPAAYAGTASVNGTVLQITAAAGETNVITVERLADETAPGVGGGARQVILVRDATNPQNAPVPGLPQQIGAILTPGVGCQPVPDENSTRPALKCTAATFTLVDADLSTQQDETGAASDPERDADFFSEIDTDQKDVALPPANVTGGAGKDVLRGTLNNDVLDGGSGNDQVFGLGGDDQLLPGAGFNNPVSGGPGSDLISYASSTVDVTVTLDGKANDGENGRDNVLADMENITTGSGNDLVVAAANNNTIITGAGNDRVQSLGGDDRVEAGEGDNTVDAGDGNDTGTSGGGKDTVTLGIGNDTFNVGAGDNTVDGGDGNDDVTAGAGTDRLEGFGGDDTLRGGDGENTLSGGAGVDNITGGTGVDRANGGDGNDVVNVAGGDNFAEGGAGDDQITTTAGSDTIDGGSGADTIQAGDGANTIKGGSENDGITSGAGIDLVSGGAGNDTITTNAENDSVNGGEGADTMNLGAGAADTVDYLERSVNIYADLNGVPSGAGCFPNSGGSCEGDNISGTENLTGGNGNDLLVGNGSANVLKGGKGATDGDDDLRGGLGADDLIGGDGYDRVSYRDRTNGVTVTLDGQAGDGESGENDNVRGDIERVEGGGGNDSLTGSDQRNDLYGLAGDDALEGLLGPDLMEGGDGEDTVSYASRSGNITVTNDGTAANDGETGEGDNVGPDVENLTGGSGNDRLTTVDVAGVGVVNELRGGPGNDRLDGGRGSDDIFGGSENDVVVYTGRPAAETVVFQADGSRNDGTGVVDVKVDDLSCAVQSTIVSAERDLIAEDIEGVEGGQERNVLIATSTAGADFVGGDGPDILVGAQRADLLQGGAGDDVICGGAGNDVISGGAGADGINGQADDDRLTDREAADRVEDIEGFGGSASLPAFAAAPQQAPAQQQPAQQQPTQQAPAQQQPTTQQAPAQQQPTTQQAPAPQQPAATQPTGPGSTAGSSTSGSGSTAGSGSTTGSGSAATQQAEAKVTEISGTRSFMTVATTKSGAKTVARVRGTVAGSCKSGQKVVVKVLAGKKVVGSRTVKLAKGCAFNAVVPVATKAKKVKATVALAGTSKTLRMR